LSFGAAAHVEEEVAVVRCRMLSCESHSMATGIVMNAAGDDEDRAKDETCGGCLRWCLDLVIAEAREVPDVERRFWVHEWICGRLAAESLIAEGLMGRNRVRRKCSGDVGWEGRIFTLCVE
jgi:hypothetical protein